MTERTYDVIVVGAGSAGSVLASRLSENTARQVLLLDAGPDYARLEDFPDELSRARSMAASFPGHPNNWSFVGEIVPGRNYPLARGKVVGGSSAVNGTYFIRGRREDFDAWAAAGNDLWSYEQVLPYFRKSETDLDFDNEFHGQDGPMPVRRPRDDELRPVSRAFIEACLQLGHVEDPDKNALAKEGVGPIPRNCVDGYRMNTAITYLQPARQRDNLTVLGDTFVRRVVLRNGRAVGVEAERNGRPVEFRADEVILSAGSINSAHLLMLSGIGPAEHLRRHDITVVHDSPGVGQGIKDHPSVFVNYTVRDDGGPLPPNFMPFQVCLNHTSDGSTVDGDLQITCGSAPYSRMLGRPSGRRMTIPSYLTRPLATLSALRRLPTRLVYTQARNQDNLVLLCSLDAEASTGEIALKSADPRVPPRISLNYLSDPADLPRIVANVRLAIELLQTRQFARLGAAIVNPVARDFAGDQALASWVKDNIGTSAHTTSSVRMGPASDPTAVVDQYCRVYGVEGLRVVDISIMPTIIRRGPAATAVMIGERAADLIEQTS